MVFFSLVLLTFFKLYIFKRLKSKAFIELNSPVVVWLGLEPEAAGAAEVFVKEFKELFSQTIASVFGFDKKLLHTVRGAGWILKEEP